jgi:hypothetical protein
MTGASRAALSPSVLALETPGEKAAEELSPVGQKTPGSGAFAVGPGIF